MGPSDSGNRAVEVEESKLDEIAESSRSREQETIQNI